MSRRRPHLNRVIAAALATLITLVCVVMAAAAAFERAQAGHERWLITALASLIVLCLHLIPALVKRTGLMVTIYVPCLLVTLYGHAHFFMAAQAAQGAARAAAAPSASAVQAQALRDQIASLAARPLTAVAADLAVAQADLARANAAVERCQRNPAGRCTSAQATAQAAQARLDGVAVERDQARKADGLREQLATLAAGDDSARRAAAVDPVDAELSALFGVQPRTLGLLVALLQSLLAEVLAGVLWSVALGERPQAARAATLPTATAGAAPAAVGNAGAGQVAAPSVARALRSLLSYATCTKSQTGMFRRWRRAPAMRDPPLFVTPC